MRFRFALVVVAAGILLGPATVLAVTLGLHDLRCEYLRDPLGIDTPAPRLSWAITSDQRGTRQSAYRVLVASSVDRLNEHTGDVWDSGRVGSSQSNQVEYAGKPLVSGRPYFWKVAVWDQNDTASGWSEAASWSMGLLKPDDWQAKWIGPAVPPNDREQKTPLPAPLLRKAFSIDKPVRRATAYVCGLGYYEMHLNGQKVGDHVLDPPITQADKRVLYVTHDVTRQLHQGRNAVAVELGNGWWNAAVPDVWNMHTASWRAQPQLRLQIDVEFGDGSTQRISTDELWSISTGPTVFDQLRVGEVYDARLEKPGWTTADYDDTAWGRASVRQTPMAKPVASMVNPIRVMATLRSKTITQPKPGVYVFDIGQNIAGWPKLTVRGAAGTTVTMRCSDLLKSDGTVDMGDIKKHVRSPDVQCNTYVLKGEGIETWEPKFSYQGFQYVQVEGLPTAPDDTVIAGRVVHSSFERGGSFECSNDLLNKIEAATRWAYIGNFVGFPTDCPHREKNGWTGDAHLTVQLGLEHYRAEAEYTQWIQTLVDCQRPDGKLPAIAPTAGWGYERLDGPAWEAALFLIPWEMYVQSGDEQILKTHYHAFERWLAFYGAKADGHIVKYGLGDWAPVKTKTPAEMTSTAYYYRAIRITAQTARLLGDTVAADRYDRLAAAVRTAFNQAFYDRTEKRYRTDSQTAHSCALYQDLAPEEDRAAIAARLAATVRRADNHIDTGILGAKYVLRALSDHGYADLAWQMTTQRTRPSWGNWIDRGATTLWENWNGAESRNHVMFGDISSWYMEYIAGLRPDPSGPGYRKVIVRPHLLGDLTWAKADRVTAYGTVVVEWRRSGKQLSMSVTIPPNTSATVDIPAAEMTAVTESGLPANQQPGIKVVGVQNKTIRLAIESGTYTFQSTIPE